MDLTDIYRPFHPNNNEYIFFLAPQGLFSKINHRLEHKISFTLLKKIQNILFTA